MTKRKGGEKAVSGRKAKRKSRGWILSGELEMAKKASTATVVVPSSIRAFDFSDPNREGRIPSGKRRFSIVPNPLDPRSGKWAVATVNGIRLGLCVNVLQEKHGITLPLP